MINLFDFDGDTEEVDPLPLTLEDYDDSTNYVVSRNAGGEFDPDVEERFRSAMLSQYQSARTDVRMIKLKVCLPIEVIFDHREFKLTTWRKPSSTKTSKEWRPTEESISLARKLKCTDRSTARRSQDLRLSRKHSSPGD